MINKCTKAFFLAFAALGISAACVFAIPLLEAYVTAQYVLAGVFWFCLVAEMVLLGIGNWVRKRIEQMSPHLKQPRGFGKIGAFCFVQNREAKIVDIALLVSIICVAALVITRADSVWLAIIGITATYVFFHLHCILNGILYKSIKYYQTVTHKRREQE